MNGHSEGYEAVERRFREDEQDDFHVYWREPRKVLFTFEGKARELLPAIRQGI